MRRPHKQACIEIRTDTHDALVCTPSHALLQYDTATRSLRWRSVAANPLCSAGLAVGHRILVAKPTPRLARITAISATPQPHTVYDLRVPRIHNFVANNFIVHNCGTPEYMSPEMILGRGSGRGRSRG